MPAFPPYTPSAPTYTTGVVPGSSLQQGPPPPFVPRPTSANSRGEVRGEPLSKPMRVRKNVMSHQVDAPRREVYVNVLWTDVIPPSGVPGHPSLLQEGVVAARPGAKAIKIRRPGESSAYAIQQIKALEIGKSSGSPGESFKASLQPSGLSKFVSVTAPDTRSEAER